MEKSIKELSWNVTEPEYRADSAISYSTLSRFEREGWRKLSSLFDKIETPALTFGQAVDTKLTDGDEAFNERFIVCDFPPLSDTLISITKFLHKNFHENHRKLSMIDDAEISRAALMFNYYANPKYENFRVKSIKENCDEYYSLLTLAGDKTVLSQDDYSDVMACVDELKTNPATKYFFSSNPFETHIEKVFQLKFRAEFQGIPVRCMFDEIIVDHEKKMIYPIDLKTTGHPEEEFEGSFVTWRYDIQSKLYTYILQECIKNDEYFKDFKIQPYQFVVINRRTVAPIVWVYEGNFGQVDLKDEKGNILRDWRKILDELHYYLRYAGKYSIRAMANNCVLKISNLTPC